MSQTVLEARDVSKRFGGLVALNAVDFSLDEGTIASIIGPNGAGKTTLFNVFTGIYRPDGGDVFASGKSIVGLTPDQVTALGVCRTFQNIRLFANMTALENVMVGRYCRTSSGALTSVVRGPKFRREEAARPGGLVRETAVPLAGEYSPALARFRRSRVEEKSLRRDVVVGEVSRVALRLLGLTGGRVDAPHVVVAENGAGVPRQELPQDGDRPVDLTAFAVEGA